MAMPLVAPLFVENDGYQSTITMVNELTKAVHGTLLARAQDGAELSRKVILFPAHSQTSLAVSDLLGGPGVQRVIGSIELDPDPMEVTSMAIAAQLSIVDNRTAPATYFEEEFLMVDPSMPSSYRAVVPPTLASPTLALFSTEDSPQHVDVACTAEASRVAAHKSFSLPARQTLLVSACGDPPSNAEPSLEAAFQPAKTQATPLALSIQTDAPPGSLAVWGVSAIGQNHPAEIALNVVNPESLKTKETVFAGVPIGTADLLPGDNFTPDLAIANYGTSPANVTVSYSSMQADTPETKTVATVSLAAGAVQRVSLPELTGDPTMRNSFVITSDAAPGAVIANLVLKGQHQYPAVQLIGKDPAVNNGGGHPWTIAGNNRSTALLFNRTDKEQLFNVNIAANGKKWHQEYQVKPSETRAIDIYAIIRNQVKDLHGAKLPADATSGEISWFTVDPGKGTGRVLVSNPATGLARNFSCGYNIVLCGSGMYNSYSLFGISLLGELGDAYAYTCTAYNPEACSGQSYGENDGGYSYDWWSNNTGIATVYGSNTNPSASFYGQSVGTTTGTGQISSSYCQSNSQGTTQVNPTVQISQVSVIPSSMSASNGSTTVTVQLYVPVIPAANQTVTASLATYSSTPAGNNVSYQLAQEVTIGPGKSSPIKVTFTASASSDSQAGSIVIAAALTNPSSGITISAPTGTPPSASNDASLTLTH